MEGEMSPERLREVRESVVREREGEQVMPVQLQKGVEGDQLEREEVGSRREDLKVRRRSGSDTEAEVVVVVVMMREKRRQ